MMMVMTEGVNKRMQSMQSNSLSKCVGITFWLQETPLFKQIK